MNFFPFNSYFAVIMGARKIFKAKKRPPNGNAPLGQEGAFYFKEIAKA
ncbi:MAG TPA: hypothetical protein VIG33_14950 [Pseudobdellovibrionaceae bacterium]|jgi:hypothetical protein